MEKMTFKFDETINMVELNYDKLYMLVIETDESWSKYFVTTNTGIRKSFYDNYNFKNEIDNDMLGWLMTTAVNFFEMKRTRLEKSSAENEQNEVENT